MCTDVEGRLARIRKLELEWARYEDYRPTEGPPKMGLRNWDYFRRAEPGGILYYCDFKTADPPNSATEYLANLKPEDTAEGELYFHVPYASGSDYANGVIDKANHRAFITAHGDWPFVWDAVGGYGAYAVILGLTGLLKCEDDTFDMILEVMERLQDYPLICDETYSNLEMELSDEAWECWASHDFRKAVENCFPDTDFDWPDDLKLRDVFQQVADKANEYWEPDGPDMWIRVEKVAECVELEDVEKWSKLEE